MFYVSAYLGEAHGSAKSARDFAKALLAHCGDTRIVCPRTEFFDSSAAGYPLHEPIWYRTEARKRYGRGWVGRVRGRLDRSFRHLMRSGMRRAMHREVVVVNGWASISYWRSLAAAPKRSALIVRESPRHFEYGTRGTPISQVIREFATFDQLIFVSRIGQEEWTRMPELSAKPSFCFPNCCEEEEVASVSSGERDAIRSGLGLSGDEKMIICPGAVEERKGIEIVLRNWKGIKKKLPTARLIILGKATPDYGLPLVEGVAAGKYGPSITHIAEQPSAIPYICAADMMLFPSRAEALPRVILEAMAAGTPVVASTADGIPELIDHNRTGLLFDWNEPESMVAGVVKALTEPTQAAAWADAARRRYDERFSRRRQMERMPALLSWLGVL
ncbi:hypothetical protein CKO31_14260 [Thiohalocapsa halophila]|uniref:Glycosyl transferase family 1 domain-containing protein n=1 Tax=Thiohalocapsa halophila TaxID=69359 RepID=A0ABS1CJ06_9GAMM|nr:glycosyltransferase family 4 protein [Thiohalocapsa halophila]MBK1631877.1 hypothetical protein [Thiohalocapsa halophila]